jgi:hypothetical protein
MLDVRRGVGAPRDNLTRSNWLTHGEMQMAGAAQGVGMYIGFVTVHGSCGREVGGRIKCANWWVLEYYMATL